MGRGERRWRATVKGTGRVAEGTAEEVYAVVTEAMKNGRAVTVERVEVRRGTVGLLAAARKAEQRKRRAG